VKDPDSEVVRLELEDSLDLHGFRPRDVPEVVESYLEAAYQLGFREVRLIHGRGTGFQRHRVRQLLTQSCWVKAFDDAPPARGGWGATLVALISKTDE
jgi:DNA-nicking Smr family endonuclease